MGNSLATKQNNIDKEQTMELDGTHSGSHRPGSDDVTAELGLFRFHGIIAILTELVLLIVLTGIDLNYFN